MATTDMDIDMDIDLDLGDDYMDPEPAPQSQILPDTATIQPKIPDAYLDDSIPEKVHIRGLDNLATEDIKAFAAEHFPLNFPTRVEWIDDTSANVVYSTLSAASAALTAFTDPAIRDAALPPPADLRAAKQLSMHPNVRLEVRQANSADIKKPRARDASRFYLMNPDKDPANRPRRYDDRRAGRGRNDRPLKRRRSLEDEAVPFDVSMYDDVTPEAPVPRPIRRPAGRHDPEHREKRVRFGGRSEDLFADRLNNRIGQDLSRPRSASPDRMLADGDGRFGFSEPVLEDGEEDHYARANRRTSTAANARKELFPTTDGNGNSRTKELFPNRSSATKHDTPSNAGRELFANANGGSPAQHRRSQAFDARDNSHDLFPRGSGNGSSSTGAAHMDRVSSPGRPRSHGLAERVTGGPGSRDLVSGQINRHLGTSTNTNIQAGNGDGGLRIRGGGGVTTSTPNPNTISIAVEENPGFTIKGVAKGLNPRVKELFPQKLGSGADAEGDLFAEKMRGKMGARRRAEDLFGV